MTKGQRIKHLREKIGKTQTAFADMINVSKQTLYKYENNIITNIPSDKIEAIAAACGSTPAYIMGWVESSEQSTESNVIHRRLAPDESALVKNYERLNDTGKQKALEYITDLTEQAKYTEKEDAIQKLSNGRA